MTVYSTQYLSLFLQYRLCMANGEYKEPAKLKGLNVSELCRGMKKHRMILCFSGLIVEVSKNISRKELEELDSFGKKVWSGKIKIKTSKPIYQVKHRKISRSRLNDF